MFQETVHTIETPRFRLRIVLDPCPLDPRRHDEAWEHVQGGQFVQNSRFHLFDYRIDREVFPGSRKGESVLFWYFGREGEVIETDRTNADGFLLAGPDFDAFTGLTTARKRLRSLRAMFRELQAWAEGDVYGFFLEQPFRHKGETYYRATDSCFGFYGHEGIAGIADYAPAVLRPAIRKIARRGW